MMKSRKHSEGDKTMNIMHLKYAVEVEKCKSINRAAENLFMGQPNLSRAIKELEESLGITIFNRTSRGMTVTADGEEFLMYAHRILEQVDQVEEVYRGKKSGIRRFSVSVPRASYISAAFSDFSRRILSEKPMEIYYKETNSLRTISNILQNGYKLGIVRYQRSYEKYYSDMLEEKGLEGRLIAEFSFQLIAGRESPLARLSEVHTEDLRDYVEIIHADPYVPSLSYMDVMKRELTESVNKRIFVYERASQFELMASNHRTFMWVSPVQKELLDRYGLVRLNCPDRPNRYKDVLIYRKGYVLTEQDYLFVDALCAAKRRILDA